MFAETREERVLNVGLELIGKASSLRDNQTEVQAVVCARPGFEVPSCLFAAGADRVVVLERDDADYCLGANLAGAVASLARAGRPSLFLFGATALGRDLAPAVAAILNTGCAADICDMGRDPEGNFLQVAAAFGGRLMATIITPDTQPVIATVRPAVFACASNHAPHGLIERIGTGSPGTRVKLIKAVQAGGNGLDFAQSSVIVAGGAGVRDSAGWRMIHLLAQKLRGAVGGTRPVYDAGYVEEQAMIGCTGQSVHPGLYIAVGVSGDIHHMVGVRDAAVIMAINNDPAAPIFRQADYGIIGDYRTVLPLLLQDLEQESPVRSSGSGDGFLWTLP